jgi:2,4-dienoyl-CoA reductase-like NADH-dependent reductase (Old Yellow Enzyme family)/thioredoxin reductase
MLGEQRFPKLFESGKIGSMELKNRLVMAPVETHYADEGGYVTDRQIDYYEARARGGVGLVITEDFAPDYITGRGGLWRCRIDNDKFIPRLSKLAQAIHKHGTKVVLNLQHAGAEASPTPPSFRLVAPSPLLREDDRLPEELTIAEIGDIVERFAEAAKRAKEAGVDGVQLHGAHIFLIAQFLSLVWNKRQDAYGGRLKNRARFLLEIVKSIKYAAGADFPVLCRFNGAEYYSEQGLTLQEGIRLARMLEEVGADAVHISTWVFGGYPTRTLIPSSQVGAIGDARYAPAPAAFSSIPSQVGAFVPLAEAIKRNVSIPVIAVGRIDPELGERILQEGKADFIAIGRGLLADPELPNKTRVGRLGEITPCIQCLEEAAGEAGGGSAGIVCAVNATLGRERQYAIAAARKKKSIIVVGGGPAGMEAGRVAALRSHEVILYEKGERLGGQLWFASKAPEKSARIEPLIAYLASATEKAGVKVELAREVTPEAIQQASPDVVVIATGATPFIPQITGVQQANVVTALDVLAGKVEVGERVVIVGGEQVGCETADFLSDRGRKVVIMRRGPRLAASMLPFLRLPLINRLRAKGVVWLTNIKYEEITDRGVIVTYELETTTIEADTVVLAAGARPRTEVYEGIRGKIAEVYLAGDCVAPRRIYHAIHEGHAVGQRI